MSARRVLLAGIATPVIGMLVAALAFGQDVVPIRITAKATVTPNKAGTPAHPQGVRIGVDARIQIPHDFDPPLVQTVDVWFPKGGLYNGGKFPTCSQAAMAHGGVKVCPPRSIMGHGVGTADADGVTTHPTLTVVNGGPDKVYFYVVLRVPARVQQPVLGTITKVNSPRWSYRLHVAVPRNLQIVAGIPLRLERFRSTVGRGDWIATIGCPRDHRWRYHVETSYDSGQVVNTDGFVTCRS
jgi:hypothetical protein